MTKAPEKEHPMIDRFVLAAWVIGIGGFMFTNDTAGPAPVPQAAKAVYHFITAAPKPSL